MKYNLNYPQREVVESQTKIKPNEWFILDTIANLSLLDRTEQKEFAGIIFFSIDYRDVIDQLPALELKLDNVKKIVRKLVNERFLIRSPKNKGSKTIYFRMGDQYLKITGLMTDGVKGSTGKKVTNLMEKSNQLKGKNSSSQTTIFPNSEEKSSELSISTPLVIENTSNTNLNTHDEKAFKEKNTDEFWKYQQQVQDSLRTEKLQAANANLKSFGLTQSQIDKIFGQIGRASCRERV